MNNRKQFLVAVLMMVGVLFFVSHAFSQAIKTSALSDEQQGILAVRTAKASVVDIIGVSNNLSTSTLFLE